MTTSNQYGAQTKLLAQLEITYEDGSRDTIVTDKRWQWSNDGAIRFADNKDGEVIDRMRHILAHIVQIAVKFPPEYRTSGKEILRPLLARIEYAVGLHKSRAADQRVLRVFHRGGKLVVRGERACEQYVMRSGFFPQHFCQRLQASRFGAVERDAFREPEFAEASGDFSPMPSAPKRFIRRVTLSIISRESKAAMKYSPQPYSKRNAPTENGSASFAPPVAGSASLAIDTFSLAKVSPKRDQTRLRSIFECVA